jgi:hypothetical protein
MAVGRQSKISPFDLIVGTSADELAELFAPTKQIRSAAPLV